MLNVVRNVVKEGAVAYRQIVMVERPDQVKEHEAKRREEARRDDN